jgi:hypothetical protein
MLDSDIRTGTYALPGGTLKVTGAADTAARSGCWERLKVTGGMTWSPRLIHD